VKKKLLVSGKRNGNVKYNAKLKKRGWEGLKDSTVQGKKNRVQLGGGSKEVEGRGGKGGERGQRPFNTPGVPTGERGKWGN